MLRIGIKKIGSRSFQIHGFIGQSYIVTSHNDVFGSDKGGVLV
jgi:hypothetical protein